MGDIFAAMKDKPYSKQLKQQIIEICENWDDPDTFGECIRQATQLMEPWPISARHATLSSKTTSLPAHFPLIRSLELVDKTPPKGLVKWSEEGLMQHIKRLDMRECFSAKSLDFLAGFGALESITLRDGKFKDVDAMAGLDKLKKFEIHGSKELLDLEGLEGMEQLEVLDISGCDFVSFDALQHIVGLRRLTINECYGLHDLSFLANMSALEDLTITTERELEHVDCIGHLPQLKRLSLGFIPFEEVRFLAPLGPHLERLELHNLSISDWGGLSSLTNVREVTFLHVLYDEDFVCFDTLEETQAFFKGLDCVVHHSN